MGREVSWRGLQPAGLQMGSSAVGDAELFLEGLSHILL